VQPSKSLNDSDNADAFLMIRKRYRVAIVRDFAGIGRCGPGESANPLLHDKSPVLVAAKAATVKSPHTHIHARTWKHPRESSLPAAAHSSRLFRPQIIPLT